MSNKPFKVFQFLFQPITGLCLVKGSPATHPTLYSDVVIKRHIAWNSENLNYFLLQAKTKLLLSNKSL